MNTRGLVDEDNRNVVCMARGQLMVHGGINLQHTLERNENETQNRSLRG